MYPTLYRMIPATWGVSVWQCLSLVLVRQSSRSILPRPPMTSSSSRSSKLFRSCWGTSSLNPDCDLTRHTLEQFYLGRGFIWRSVSRNVPQNVFHPEVVVFPVYRRISLVYSPQRILAFQNKLLGRYLVFLSLSFYSAVKCSGIPHRKMTKYKAHQELSYKGTRLDTSTADSWNNIM